MYIALTIKNSVTFLINFWTKFWAYPHDMIVGKLVPIIEAEVYISFDVEIEALI